MNNKEFTLNGKTYLPEEETNECDGCAGLPSHALCVQLPACHDVIFVEVKAEE